jgi:sodium/potassium-transporting ATPase subunit alpha
MHGTGLDMNNIAASGGLSVGAHAAKLLKNGKNILTPPKEVSELVKFLHHFTNPLMLLLLVAGVLLFMAYGIQSEKDHINLILGGALVFVVIFTCILSYFQEKAASNVMASLKNMMPNQCTVIRGGKEARISAMDLVTGDLVRLGIGANSTHDGPIVGT